VSAFVRIESPRGHIQFEDTLDHFENAVLRLLGLDREAFEYWLARTEDEEGDSLLERLGLAFRRLSPMGRSETLMTGTLEDGPGGIRGALWHTSIADDRSVGVARSRDGSLAWLVQAGDDIWKRVVTRPDPSQGDADDSIIRALPTSSAYSAWRTEKAKRQARDLVQLVAKSRPRVLEVGQISNHFRQAVVDAAARHEGIERDAIDEVHERLDSRENAVDAITMWDFVTRVAEPTTLLAAAVRHLKPGGILAIKTPNIRCPEARLFGPHYHSFRRAHLVYYSVPSLVRAVEAVGLQRVRVSTVSHLLVGFVGRTVTDQLAADAQGSDIIAYFRKPQT
jgi:hypothetical protein